ncbi:hypothetical protein GGQ99_004777 [Aminobacter niigataensis]|uniref:Uncharacterized protein n=1 Tax=Aminobacter niigataensis TaxID=83265 RepID=A0ABR6L8R7_9HYPH|nr:hypothetical protein [Aminobacter niigataensis]
MASCRPGACRIPVRGHHSWASLSCPCPCPSLRRPHQGAKGRRCPVRRRQRAVSMWPPPHLEDGGSPSRSDEGTVLNEGRKTDRQVVQLLLTALPTPQLGGLDQRLTRLRISGLLSVPPFYLMGRGVSISGRSGGPQPPSCRNAGRPGGHRISRASGAPDRLGLIRRFFFGLTAETHFPVYQRMGIATVIDGGKGAPTPEPRA